MAFGSRNPTRRGACLLRDAVPRPSCLASLFNSLVRFRSCSCSCWSSSLRHSFAIVTLVLLRSFMSVHSFSRPHRRPRRTISTTQGRSSFHVPTNLDQQHRNAARGRHLQRSPPLRKTLRGEIIRSRPWPSQTTCRSSRPDEKGCGQCASSEREKE